MGGKALIPRRIVDIKGRLSYSEGAQAWNTIRFKEELLKEFPQLKEKRSVFTYQLFYYRTYEEFQKAMKELQKKGVLPILMFFYKEE